MQKGFAAVAVVIVVVILLIVGIVATGFYLGRVAALKQAVVTNNVPVSPLPIASAIDASQSAESSPSGVVVGPYTISYAVVGEQIYLRYRDRFYTPNSENPYSIETPYFPNGQSINWIGILNAPEGLDHNGFDDILSLMVLSNKKSFIFVTRWEKQAPVGETATPWLLNVYLFDGAAKLTNLFSSISPSSDKFPIPIIDQLSSDGKYVSFDMHGCWNCDGSVGEKMLMNISTKNTKRIGRVLEFKWLDNGKFSFKDYIEKECVELSPGPCHVDPNTLSVKLGQF